MLSRQGRSFIVWLAANVILAFAFFVATASASTAVRYAGPGGTSPADHCEDPAHPCSLFNAADQGATTFRPGQCAYQLA